MAIVCVGIDLAKNVFAVHGINEAGRPELVRPAVPRDKLLALVSALPPCVIGMEACSGAHHWARQFIALGHTVRLIAPKFVTPYRMSGKRGKNDAADAAAICEAVQRPHMRFVPLKSVEQQNRLMVHRARQAYVEQRTGHLNRIRGLLSEVTWLDERTTKAGDAYLRTLFILGARAVLAAAPKKNDPISRWVVALAERRGYWKAVVAMAAKNARMAWAVLRKGEAFALPA
ncbi:IS110 family transposase [Ideonella dechloratans]|uniref:IS110 family transposase n=1 Tax=Ideonella dechloratans TaxID=36863 RepID=A0A643FGZ7_IDEDE|nr:IS110 family transposase [Ideonella dechloratans]KAB0584512.1 IS110 family transposase [Ideonella dechloratans]UFU10219.1 IS110 family transposase [Ideonella dechloratans]